MLIFLYLAITLKEERFKFILSALKENGKVNYGELSENLDISEDTVRRDIEYLHSNGLLWKVRGGAIPLNKNPLAFEDRTGYHSEEKETIALKAQSMLKKGMTVFMDGGTTVCAVAEKFPLDSSFRVITNNMALLPILSRLKGVEVIVLGGIMDHNTETNVGTKTSEDVKQYVADLYLMGTCAISVKFGITAAVREDGAVKKAMLGSAKTKVVLCDSKKIGTVEPFTVCGLEEIDILVTELPSDDVKLDELRFQNIKLI